MNNIESQLIQSCVHACINERYQATVAAPQPELSAGAVAPPEPPTPVTPPDQVINEISDFIKTYTRIKCEVKHISGNYYAAIYKDSYKNPNTYYFYV
jgi:hypothetical protein